MSQSAMFEPTWESLSRRETPEWFRDAKFGIWAHWGPQCEPEQGDWYARQMYMEGSETYRSHLAAYGHPSEFGFKDVLREWKAERWDPEALVSLYRRTGAEYFVAMANHHDNMDLWDSSHQPWNSVALGPRRNIVGEWASAARRHGLPFGVSVHASHAWSWYEFSQGSDAEGPYAGVPYDGRLTKADGVGKWWEGLDPQDLYAQNHRPFFARDTGPTWAWGGGYDPVPDEAYCERFFDRTVELIDKFRPDLVYFDDNVLPLHPISDVGLRIAAHLYNGNPDAVLNGKVLDEAERKAMVWDIERGMPDDIQPLPWQIDTCLGEWHYKRSIFENGRYKSAREVVHILLDVVSKNGNLLLSVPLRGDGTLDKLEIEILRGIGDWMSVHREAIVGTRPWRVFGEGPASATAAPLKEQGFNEGSGVPFSGADVRFTQRGELLYATTLGRPEGAFTIPSPGVEVANVSLLGHGPVAYVPGDRLTIVPPAEGLNDIANVFRIELAS